jgi:uncharacterized protein
MLLAVSEVSVSFVFEKEQRLMLPGVVGPLEAVLHQGNIDGYFAERQWILVVCHPHPVHGGTMDNKVVTTLMRTYRDLGIHVLRFNFRGVGESEGAFDNGVGELNDLLAVITWVRATLPQSPVLLAGFSFGSAIAAQATYAASHIKHLALIAPPVERYEYAQNNQFPCVLCVIQGDKDERVIAEGVYSWVQQLQGEVRLLCYPDAGHFFHGFLSELKTDLTQILLQQLAAIK